LRDVVLKPTTTIIYFWPVDASKVCIVETVKPGGSEQARWSSCLLTLNRKPSITKTCRNKTLRYTEPCTKKQKRLCRFHSQHVNDNYRMKENCKKTTYCSFSFAQPSLPGGRKTQNPSRSIMQTRTSESLT